MCHFFVVPALIVEFRDCILSDSEFVIKTIISSHFQCLGKSSIYAVKTTTLVESCWKNHEARQRNKHVSLQAFVVVVPYD